ncbi:MAG: amino acid ABC transporter substrate-binding protein [Erysipelotrichaceae bacterium]|nr:amino acid ABC transporter substrate-binding protein [Erysipelotrichaceae bacterium]MCI9524494.1 amino acid ABC transporter substrate-binding protein [Erysipelotrichaceae bacterium]
MKKLCAIALTSLFILAGCGGDKQDDKKVFVGLTSSGFAPYELRLENGTLTGFDIEVTELVAKEMGYEEVRWEDLDFDALIGAVNTGKGDMVAAALAVTPEREESVEFSIPYYTAEEETAYYVVTLKDGGIDAMEDLKGKKVGMQIGTIQETAINNIKDEYDLTSDPRKSVGDMIQEILAKRLDFVLVDRTVADEYLKSYPELKYFQLDTDGIKSGTCFAMKKGNTELKSEVDAAIKKLQENGEIDKLVKKWLSEEEK